MPELDTQTTREARLREHIGKDSALRENGYEYVSPTPRYAAVRSTSLVGEVHSLYQTEDLNDMARYIEENIGPGDDEEVSVFDLDADEELDICWRITSFLPSGGGDHFVIDL